MDQVDLKAEQAVCDAILVNIFALASFIAQPALGPETHFDIGERFLAESKKRGYADLNALAEKAEGDAG